MARRIRLWNGKRKAIFVAGFLLTWAVTFGVIYLALPGAKPVGWYILIGFCAALTGLNLAGWDYEFERSRKARP